MPAQFSFLAMGVGDPASEALCDFLNKKGKRRILWAALLHYSVKHDICSWQTPAP